MEVNKDFEDLLHHFNAVGAKYLIVGSYAVIFYTEPRYTKDIDVWISPDPQNAERVYAALRKFGAPLRNVDVSDFMNPQMVYQVGVEPGRVDVLMGLEGFTFEDVWRRRVVNRYGREKVYLLNKEDLIRAKNAAGRPMDKIDVAKLKQWGRPKPPSRNSSRRRQKK